MNAVEIEIEVSKLAEKTFDEKNFAFDFLKAFDNKSTTIKKLRRGDSNSSDVPNGVLQRNNIHIAVCTPPLTASGRSSVTRTLTALRESTATSKAKAKFILATDGQTFEAEDLASGEPLIVCPYKEFPEHFGYFLPLAGITTARQISNTSFDIKATGRLNRLYVALLKDNSDWGSAERRNDMNHFMARLIFCFFAQDTGIFNPKGLFTKTVETMSASDSSDTHGIIREIFRTMNTKSQERQSANIKLWAKDFPHANGQLFSEAIAVPVFSKAARSQFIHVGSLKWDKINPDIFGSMIQAIADDQERGALGMHYTSVPNILKLLNPLFLGDLRAQLSLAGDNHRKLLNLRKRMAKIRVFDPACGSGNFLVIAYKQMREIEDQINLKRGEKGRKSAIPLTNFRGIELRSFAAEIARLALIIAEYQCNVIYLGQKEALSKILPLDSQNWITCGNALELDWLSLCPPTGTGVKMHSTDFLKMPLDQTEVDFEHEGGETYICSNPPYKGGRQKSKEQTDDIKGLLGNRVKNWKSLDYVAGWFMKAADYGKHSRAVSAFVSTNSICQGEQVAFLWPLIFETGHEIVFAHTSFKWANLARYNAGVTVVIIGLSRAAGPVRTLYALGDDGKTVVQKTDNINAYLASGPNIIVKKRSKPMSALAEMSLGNKPTDGGNLLLSGDEVARLDLSKEQRAKFIRRFYGSAEFIRGLSRYCLWIEDEHLAEAMQIEPICARIERVKQTRLASPDKGANIMAKRAHQMREMNIGQKQTIVIPRVSSENREYLPVGLLPEKTIVSDSAFALYDTSLWTMALIASRLHLVWIATVCGKLKTDFRYSNTLGWNSFPLPKLTAQNIQDLTRCAETILLAREKYFPATIADLYKAGAMPETLRRAHDRNDEIVERIYIGRLFRNDSERLEKLFTLYTRMTTTLE